MSELKNTVRFKEYFFDVQHSDAQNSRLENFADIKAGGCVSFFIGPVRGLKEQHE